MEQIIRIGMDTSKHVFQLHGVNAAEAPVLRKKLRRKEMVAFFEKLAPTVIAIEACGASHHWARLLQSFGHTVKLIPPQLVKPYVKRGKNDAADAEALCEAMSRPTMRFVPVKTAEQQAALMLVGVRNRLIRVITITSHHQRSEDHLFSQRERAPGNGLSFRSDFVRSPWASGALVLAPLVSLLCRPAETGPGR